MWWSKANDRVPGFTLVELTVVMIISGILMILLYSGLNQVQRVFRQYQDQQTLWTEWDGFRSQLTYDWHQAQVVEPLDQHTIACHMEDKRVVYGWYPEGWWRQQGAIIDTLQLTCEPPVFLIMNEHVSQLSAPCILQNSTLPLRLFKSYQQSDEVNRLIQ